MSFPLLPDDRHNPYAPPGAEIGSRGLAFGPTGPVSVPFTVEGVLTHSWMVFKERLGLCLGLFWAPIGMIYALLGVYFGLTAVIQAAAARDVAMVLMPILAVVGNVGFVGLSLWINLGMTIAFLKIARMQETSFGDLFSGGRFILTTLGAVILATLMIWAGLLACMIPVFLMIMALQENKPVATGVGIVGGVGIFVAALGLTARIIAPLYYVIVDRDPGVIGALSQTFRMTSGRTWKIALFFVLAMAIYFAGFLACGVGIVFAMPFIFLMITVMYVAMAGKPVGGPGGIGPGDFPDIPKPYSDPDFGALG